MVIYAYYLLDKAFYCCLIVAERSIDKVPRFTFVVGALLLITADKINSFQLVVFVV